METQRKAEKRKRGCKPSRVDPARRLVREVLPAKFLQPRRLQLRLELEESGVTVAMRLRLAINTAAAQDGGGTR